MNFKNNKGITGVDLSVSLIIVVLFVGIISSLVYNFATTSKNINRKSIATSIATQKIENLKQDFISNGSEENSDIKTITTYEYGEVDKSTGEISFYDPNYKTTPYKVETIVTKFSDYTDSSYISGLSNEERARIREENLLKIVDVTVSYNVGSRVENVQIKTAITRED